MRRTVAVLIAVLMGSFLSPGGRAAVRARVIGKEISLESASTQAYDTGGPTPRPDDLSKMPGEGKYHQAPHYDERRKSFWEGRKADRGSLVFFGDSITEGFSGMKWCFSELNVCNRGINGDCTRGLLFRMQQDVLDLHPRAVNLLVGINDLAAGSTPKQVADNIETIVDTIRSERPDVPIIVDHVMPTKTAPGKFPDNIIALNLLIDHLFAGKKDIAICDTYSLFVTPQGAVRPDEFPDMLHPNTLGHVKWTNALRPIMILMGILPSDASPSKPLPAIIP